MSKPDSSVNQNRSAKPESERKYARINDLIKEKQDLIDQENYLRRVNEFSADLLKAKSITDVLWVITTYIIEKFHFGDCVVYLLDEESDCMQKVASHNATEPAERIVQNYIVIPVGEGIVGSVAQSGVPEIIKDTRKDKRYIMDDAFRLSEITVPIVSNGKVIGVIDSEHELEDFYNERHLETLIAISNLSAIKIDNIYSMERERIHSQELERVNSELERFIYHVTHDLKSPLAGISGMMNLIKEETDPGVLNEFYTRMDLSISQMANFIDEVLSYSRNSNTAIDRSSIALCSFVEKIIDEHRFHKHVDKVDFKIEIAGELKVYTDINRLRVIFNNLISNALKYHDPLKDKSFVIVRAEEQHEFVVIEVKDNGLGMTKVEMAQVFDMFYRIPRYASQTSGSGVGLFILKKTVNKLEGTIHVDSDQGRGSVFTLKLPIKELLES